jgi:quercetin dioxygenase-like cupin family protein
VLQIHSGPKIKIEEEDCMRRSLFLVASVLLAASAAMAQDPAKVDPTHCKVVLDNAQVRVLHWTTGPHEKTPMHEHPAFVTISLTNNHSRYTYPDGKTKEIETKAGEVSWNAAEKHASESLSDQTTEVIQVELKAKPHSAHPKKP